MKRIIGFALLLAVLLGCVPVAEPTFGDVPQLEKVGMRVEFMEASPIAKSAVPLNASTIEDINLYIFNREGIPVYSKFFPDGNVGVQEISLFTRNVYSVYALANWGKEEKVLSLAQLKGLTYKASDIADICSGDEASVMTGSTQAEFPFVAPLQIHMERIVGKISVVCDFNGLDKEASIKITGVSIKNVPLECSLFGENVAGEVADGITYEGEELSAISYKGVSFYMFENMQGEVPGAAGNKEKAELIGQERGKLCSYVEIKANIVTFRHKGDIVYRFFLGTADDNCNVIRNNDHIVTVYFKGNLSEAENSVSVDSRALLDRVVGVRASPSFIAFSPGLGKTFQCKATVNPATAYDQRITWTSSNTRVAKVDQNGLLTTVGVGQCRIYVQSLEQPSAIGEITVQVK